MPTLPLTSICAFGPIAPSSSVLSVLLSGASGVREVADELVELLEAVCPPVSGVIVPFSSATLASSPPSWSEVMVTLLRTRYWLGKCQRGRIWVIVDG